MYKKFIGERITELRMDANISEYQLSQELGHSKSYIQSISSGRALPSLSALFEICDYFDISPVEFFDRDDKYPTLIYEITNKMKLLSKEDLEYINLTLNRLLK